MYKVKMCGGGGREGERNFCWWEIYSIVQKSIKKHQDKSMETTKYDELMTSWYYVNAVLRIACSNQECFSNTVFIQKQDAKNPDTL